MSISTGSFANTDVGCLCMIDASAIANCNHHVFNRHKGPSLVHSPTFKIQRTRGILACASWIKQGAMDHCHFEGHPCTGTSGHLERNQYARRNAISGPSPRGQENPDLVSLYSGLPDCQFVSHVLRANRNHLRQSERWGSSAVDPPDSSSRIPFRQATPVTRHVSERTVQSASDVDCVNISRSPPMGERSSSDDLRKHDKNDNKGDEKQTWKGLEAALASNQSAVKEPGGEHNEPNMDADQRRISFDGGYNIGVQVRAPGEASDRTSTMEDSPRTKSLPRT